NVLALFLLPVFGALSDKVDTRLGKRTPFILGGTILAVIFMIVIPYADNSRNFALFFIALGIVLLAMSTYRSPAVALMPDLTPKPLRSKANAVINLMGAVGGIITLIFIKFLIPSGHNPSYVGIFLAIAGLMILSVTILLLTIREKKLSQEIQGLDGPISDVKESEDGRRAKSELPPDVKKSLYFILAS